MHDPVRRDTPVSPERRTLQGMAPLTTGASPRSVQSALCRERTAGSGNAECWTLRPSAGGPRRTSCCAKVPGEHLRVRCGRTPGSGSHWLCLPPLLDPQQTRSRASTTSAGADGLGERCTTREHVLDFRYARRPRMVNGKGRPRRSFRPSPRPGDARRQPVPSRYGPLQHCGSFCSSRNDRRVYA